MDENNVKAISNEYGNRISDLKKSIDRVLRRQDEIKTYIASIDVSVRDLELSISQANNAEQRLRIRVAIQKNIELISRLYDSMSGFESICQRYYDSIGKLTENKIRFINLEIRKLEDKYNAQSNDVSTFVNELRELVKKAASTKETKKIEVDLKNDPNFSMD